MRRWNNLVSPSVDRRNNEVIIQIGRTVITRRRMIENLKCDYTRSGRTLTKALARYHAKNAKELARRVSMDDMFRLKGVGELAVVLFGLVLIELGEDAVGWADGKLKLSTRYTKANRRDRQARRSRGKLLLIRNG